MKNGEKKYRRNGVAIGCYVISALMLAYAFYQVGTTVGTINQYYSQTDFGPTAIEYVVYCLQAAIQPLLYALILFMLAYILDAVRKNNPANYLTDEEILDAAEARKQKREARKLARGENAAAKAGLVTTDENSVEADFAKSLDAELKADEKKTSGQRSRSNNYNKSNAGRQGGNSGSNRKKTEGSGSKSANSGSNSSKSGGNSSNSGSKSGGNNSSRNANAPKSNNGANNAKSGSNSSKSGNSNQQRNSSGSSRRKPASDKPKTESKTEPKVEEKKADIKVETKAETKPENIFDVMIAGPDKNE